MTHARGAVLAVVLVSATLMAGCFGYSTEPLHRTDVRTVVVPVFASKEFRRQIELELTRAVVQVLETRTPYKVVQDRGRADSELRGEVLDLAAPVVAEDLDSDAPIDVQVTLTCWFEWKDLRTGEVLAREAHLSAHGTYSPAIRETQDSATAEAVRDLAERIVEAMESDW